MDTDADADDCDDDEVLVPVRAKLFPASPVVDVVITLGGFGGVLVEGGGGRLTFVGTVPVAWIVAVRIADTIAGDGSA